MNAKMDSVHLRVETVQTTVDSVDTKIDSVQTRVDSVDTKVNSVRTTVRSVDTRVDSIHSTLASLDKGVKGKYDYSCSLIIEQRDLLVSKEDREIVKWLSNLNFWAKQDDTFERHQEGTGQWLLEDPIFQSWVTRDITVLWCPGDRMLLSPSSPY